MGEGGGEGREGGGGRGREEGQLHSPPHSWSWGVWQTAQRPPGAGTMERRPLSSTTAPGGACWWHRWDHTLWLPVDSGRADTVSLNMINTNTSSGPGSQRVQVTCASVTQHDTTDTVGAAQKHLQY